MKDLGEGTPGAATQTAPELQKPPPTRRTGTDMLDGGGGDPPPGSVSGRRPRRPFNVAYSEYRESWWIKLLKLLGLLAAVALLLYAVKSAS